MQPMEAYLAKVGSYLPREQEEDILRELRDHLLSLREDREAALGRPLTPAEEVALLKRHGDPLRVAGAYRSDGRSLTFGVTLVGPVLFPFYAKVLRIVLTVQLAVLSVASGAALLAGHSAADFLGRTVNGLALGFAAVTAVFIVLERRQGALGADWERGVAGRGAGGWLRSEPGVRFKAAAAFVALGAYTAFWLALPGLGLGLLLGPGALILDPGPGWPYLYHAGTVLLCGHLLLEAVTFARPGQPLLRRAGEVLLDAAGLGILAWGSAHGAWEVVAGGHGRLLQGRPLAEGLNLMVRAGLKYLLALLVVLLAVKAWKLVRSLPQPTT